MRPDQETDRYRMRRGQDLTFTAILRRTRSRSKPYPPAGRPGRGPDAPDRRGDHLPPFDFRPNEVDAKGHVPIQKGSGGRDHSVRRALAWIHFSRRPLSRRKRRLVHRHGWAAVRVEEARMAAALEVAEKHGDVGRRQP